nr:hypothetical protein [Tanacetum cinerariifolium]
MQIEFSTRDSTQKPYNEIGSYPCSEEFSYKEDSGEDLNQLWALVKESLHIRPAWTHTHNMMHAPVEWKLYDSCGVHHVTSKDNEIFIVIEKDCPQRKGLAIVTISYKFQVENYSQMEK